MNRKKALDILEVREDVSEKDLKREYRKKLLLYHPDKNNSPDASAKFIAVQEAYAYLNRDNGQDCSYVGILKSFLLSILREESTPIEELIIAKISELFCVIIENNTDSIIEYLRTINRETLAKVYDVICNYRNLMPFDSALFERIGELLREDETVILNPRLEDLLSDENVYILKRGDRAYLVPLWHHEVVFDDASGNNLVVRNYPLLPDYMELDECNVLTVNLQYHLSALWDQVVEVKIGSKIFSIDGNMLRLTGDKQRIEFLDAGVPYNNMDNMLDVSNRQSVVFMVTVKP
jgi:hypothetical protein